MRFKRNKHYALKVGGLHKGLFILMHVVIIPHLYTLYPIPDPKADAKFHVSVKDY